MSFSSRGARLASGGSDRSIKLWDVATGLLVRTLVGSASAITSVAFAPEGRRLVATSGSREVTLWDATNGAVIRILAAPADATFARFTSDGERVVTASIDGGVRVWDAAGAIAMTLRLERAEAITALAVSSGDEIVVAGTASGRIVVWDLATGTVQTRLDFARGRITALDIAPDGRTMAAAADYRREDRPLGAWDVASGARLEGWALPDEEAADYVNGLGARAPKHVADPVLALAFARDGATLAATTAYGLVARFVDGSLVELDDPLGSPRRGDRASAAAISDDLRRLAHGQAWIHVRDAAEGARGRALGHVLNAVTSVSASRDGRRVLVAARDRAPVVWDLPRASAPRLVRMIHAATTPARLTPDGDHVLAAVARGAVVTTPKGDVSGLALWSAETGELVSAYASRAPDVLAVSRDGVWGFAASAEPRDPEGEPGVKGLLFEIEPGAREQRFEGRGGLLVDAAFLADGRVTWSSAQATCAVGDPATGAVHSTRVFVRATLFPDGASALVPAARDGGLRRVDVGTGETLQDFASRGARICAIAISSDGARALTGDEVGCVTLWDTITGTALATYAGHVGDVLSVTFTAEDASFVSGGRDGTARHVDLTDGRSTTCVAAGDEWLAWSEDGRAEASARGCALVALAEGEQAVFVERGALEAHFASTGAGSQR